MVVPAGDVPVEVAEAAGWLARLVDRTCQTTNAGKRMQTDTRTARRARIQYHSMGTVISRRRARLPGTRPPNISELEEKQHAVLTANSRFVGNPYYRITEGVPVIQGQSAVTKLLAPVVRAGASLAEQSMNNREIQAAWKYHDGSKHSYWSIRNHPHFLDWANRPLPFKIYPKIEPLPLPRDVPQTGVAVLSAISGPVPSSLADSVPNLQDLARLLYFSAGITKQRAYPGGDI